VHQSAVTEYRSNQFQARGFAMVDYYPWMIEQHDHTGAKRKPRAGCLDVHSGPLIDLAENELDKLALMLSDIPESNADRREREQQSDREDAKESHAISQI